VLSIKVTDLLGDTVEEKAESFANDVRRFTKETF